MKEKINHEERTEVKPSNEHLHKANYPDHWESYYFASNYIKGDRIIDVACGPAYGTALLSKLSNTKVLGLDVDENTILIMKKIDYKLGELNQSIDKSNIRFIKKLIPGFIRLLIIKLLHKTSLKSGSIEKGKVDNASVQLVVAQKC
jgi:SAM-dependent methyltransferase